MWRHWLFQEKFQVCTPQRSWSLSSPPSKMLLPRMDSPDHSTTTSPTVSTFCIFLSIRFLFSPFGTLFSKLSYSIISLHWPLFLIQLRCSMHYKNNAMSGRVRLLLANQINSSVIVRVKSVKSCLLSLLSCPTLSENYKLNNNNNTKTSVGHTLSASPPLFSIHN